MGEVDRVVQEAAKAVTVVITGKPVKPAFPIIRLAYRRRVSTSTFAPTLAMLMFGTGIKTVAVSPPSTYVANATVSPRARVAVAVRQRSMNPKHAKREFVSCQRKSF